MAGTRPNGPGMAGKWKAKFDPNLRAEKTSVPTMRNPLHDLYADVVVSGTRVPKMRHSRATDETKHPFCLPSISA